MSQRDVKNRIASFKNVQKITRAMELISASRIGKAQSRADAARHQRAGRDQAEGQRGRHDLGHAEHSGEDVLAQLRVMAESKGCIEAFDAWIKKHIEPHGTRT